MTSLEIVDYINNERAIAFANGKASKYTELQHRDFTKKVKQTLGENAAAKFFAVDKFINGTGGQVS